MSVPTGLIAIWSGAIVNIPAGWTLCDGTAGTPDLRDKFVVGAGNTYAVDATGGATTHNHPFTGDGHFHTINAGTGIGAGTNINDFTNIWNVTGTTDNSSSLPPYYALAYIMKM